MDHQSWAEALIGPLTGLNLTTEQSIGIAQVHALLAVSEAITAATEPLPEDQPDVVPFEETKEGWTWP